MEIFSTISFSVSSIVGILSFLIGILSKLIGERVARLKLSQASEASFKEVLSSDNIFLLGNYLDDTLGKFNIREYTSNVEIQKRIDQYLDRIQNFIGTNEQIAQEEIEEKGSSEIVKVEVGDEKLSDEFRFILKEVRTGEPWNALARLRRHIEITLKNMAQIYDFPQQGHIPVRKLLNFLERNLLIDESISRHLSYAISVCNKAIHGVDVSVGEAEEAIFSAQKALEYLNNFNVNK